MTEKEAPSPTFTEAPASWNVKYIMNGFECMLTLRSTSGASLMPVTLSAIDWLKEHGAEPTRITTQALNTQAASKPAEPPKLDDGSVDPAWCAIHNCAMTRREKDGTVWYSHKVGDAYCKGKK